MRSGQGSLYSQLSTANEHFGSQDVLWLGVLLSGLRAELCMSGQTTAQLDLEKHTLRMG